jgi:hypothetical protein
MELSILGPLADSSGRWWTRSKDLKVSKTQWKGQKKGIVWSIWS